MKNSLLLVSTFIFLVNQSCNSNRELFVKGVENPVIDLNGTWEICLKPYESIVSSMGDSIIWNQIKVPGECMMQGYAIKHDKPFTYKKNIKIPSDYKGKVIKIRFEGVYSYARVWINGKYRGDHSGGFTSWECDISSEVIPGKDATIIVEVTDKADEISYASGYAKHQIGGILGNVRLLALPENYPDYLSVTTDLDEKYLNATLRVEGLTRLPGNNDQVIIELSGPDNRKIDLESSTGPVSGNAFSVTNLMSSSDLMPPA